MRNSTSHEQINAVTNNCFTSLNLEHCLVSAFLTFFYVSILLCHQMNCVSSDSFKQKDVHIQYNLLNVLCRQVLAGRINHYVIFDILFLDIVKIYTCLYDI